VMGALITVAGLVGAVVVGGSGVAGGVMAACSETMGFGGVGGAFFATLAITGAGGLVVATGATTACGLTIVWGGFGVFLGSSKNTSTDGVGGAFLTTS